MAAFPMVPFWSVFERVPKRTGYGSEELLSVYRNFGVIRKADRDDNNNRPGQSLDDYQLVEPHNLVFNKMKAWQGSLGISAYRGIVSPAYFVYRPVSDFNGRYMHHLLRCTKSIHFYAANSKGIRVNQWDLEPEQLNQMKVPLPDLDTQRRIANYLDEETAQIDTLTAELDEYVELLKKRKDQLVEAKLTEIQAPLCAVGFVGDVLLGKMVNSSPSTDADELRPYLRAAHVQPHGVMDFSVPEKLMWFTPSEAERLDLKAGDVVVVEGGAGYGRSSCLTEEMDGWGFQNSINRIRPLPERARGEYLSLMINRALARGEIGIASNVATIPHFTAEKLARFRIPVPSVEVQDEFLDVVLAELTQTDTIITQCEELKELLLKRRQVLITDVVTGKVEV